MASKPDKPTTTTTGAATTTAEAPTPKADAAEPQRTIELVHPRKGFNGTVNGLPFRDGIAVAPTETYARTLCRVWGLTWRVAK